MLGWTQCGFHKKHTGTRCAILVYLHPVGSAGHVVKSGVSGLQNHETLFFMLGWDKYRFNKKCSRTRYVEHVFLHQGRSMCHVGHFDVDGEQNVNALFFIVRSA
jgi:hypothetical protein